MPLTTTYGDDILSWGDNTLYLGTCMLGSTFGEVTRARLTRTGDEDTIQGCQSIRAWIITNPGFELTLETIFDSSVTPPGLMEPVTFPFLTSIIGLVAPGVEITWEQGGQRGLSIPAKYYDNLNGIGSNRWDGTTETMTPIYTPS
ncbi:MAG: hypothetical protein AAGD22_09385 [Verrucomicrobiota bacterium]